MLSIHFTLFGSAEMIRSRRKTTTIRQLKPKRREQMERIRKLKLISGPRWSKEQFEIADADLVSIQDIFIPLGVFIDQSPWELIEGEGFESKNEMKDFFIKQYGETILQECTFSLIEFEVTELADWSDRYVDFDYMVMTEGDSCADVFIGSKTKYPSQDDFLKTLLEKERFSFNGYDFDIDYGIVSYGAYLDDWGEEHTGWHYSTENDTWDDPHGPMAWLVRHEHGTFLDAEGGVQ